MSDNPSPYELFRRPQIIISIAVAVLIVLGWLVLFFIPKGHTVATLNAKYTTLKKKVAAAKLEVDQLRKLTRTTAAFQARLTQLHHYVPTTPQLPSYILAIQATVKASGSTYVSMEPGPPEPATGRSGPSTASKAGTGSYTILPVTLSVDATYDQLLALITDIYKLTRLTVIASINITGGGPGTKRSTLLTVTMKLQTFSVTKPTATSSSTSTSTTPTTTTVP
jgi:Tfp pilus assembly protein PilO